MPSGPRSSVALVRLKIVVFAPIPSAIVTIARSVKPGLRASTRNAKRTSCSMTPKVHSFRSHSEWEIAPRLNARGPGAR